jgi:NADPH:quinone reductase-like Zn-dependent oxidoreductase
MSALCNRSPARGSGSTGDGRSCTQTLRLTELATRVSPRKYVQPDVRPCGREQLIAEVRRVAWPWVVDGRLRPPIDATFDLADARLAHLRLEAGEHVGKIVLTV